MACDATKESIERQNRILAAVDPTLKVVPKHGFLSCPTLYHVVDAEGRAVSHAFTMLNLSIWISGFHTLHCRLHSAEVQAEIAFRKEQAGRSDLDKLFSPDKRQPYEDIDMSP